YIEGIVDSKGLKGTLTYYDRYKVHKKDDKGYKGHIFDLEIGGSHYRLLFEFYDGIIFELGEDDYGYDDGEEKLIGVAKFIDGKIYAQSIELSLYRDYMVLVEQAELFLYGSKHGWSEISFNIKDDFQYIHYNGVTGNID